MEQSAREQPDPDDQEETQLQDESGIIGDASTASNCVGHADEAPRSTTVFLLGRLCEWRQRQWPY